MSDELFFLIARFLERSPCQTTFQLLKEELVAHQLLPPRLDWQGGQHQQTFDELKRKYSYIGPEHLLELCRSYGNEQGNAGGAKIVSKGYLSLLRLKKADYRKRSQLYPLLSRNRWPESSASEIPSIQNNACLLRSSELLGNSFKKELVPTTFYSKLKLCSRNLGHLSAVFCVLFDRTGRYIFTGADDLLVKVWSAIDGRLLSTFRGASSEIADLAVSCDNRLLAAGSCDKIVRVWCLRTGAPAAVLTGHSGMITSINFCPSTRGSVQYLASTSSDGSASFWEYYYTSEEDLPRFLPRPHKFCERLRPGQCQMLCTSFSPGGNFMAAGCGDHHVRVYFMHGKEGPERILEIEAHVDRVDSIQWADRGLKFISGSKDGTAIVWTFENQEWRSVRLKMTTQLPGAADSEEENRPCRLKVSMVAWIDNNNRVVTAASDLSLKVWDAKSGQLLSILRGHEDEAFVLEPHPTDPRILLSAGHDGKVIIWDVERYQSLKIFTNFIEGQGHGAVYDANKCILMLDGLVPLGN
ncbi:PH-interacting protein-like [Artemia franciscana]|uniref:PH-interacting protein-like n=1 Tax=Artemia franciscana TaxID=6661 RepID=UPI0032DA456D